MVLRRTICLGASGLDDVGFVDGRSERWKFKERRGTREEEGTEE